MKAKILSALYSIRNHRPNFEANEQYYWDAKKTRTGMWGDNKYGQLRRNLLDFMIDYFEKLNAEFEQ